MVPILIAGLVLVTISLGLSFLELKKFFDAVSQLNRYTMRKGFGGYIMYLPRFICLTPLLLPVALDALIIIICGGIGLNGGTIGGIIGLMASSVASILVRVYRHMSKNKEYETKDWRVSHV